MDFSELKGKRVLITGHTGFKGSWMCRVLHVLGAEVYGYGLDPPTTPSLYNLAKIGSFVHSKIGDIVDFDTLFEYYKSVSPDFVIHMAAQPIVREGYKNPRDTYNINVMGTVNILECVRLHPCALSFLNVTTDKVYRNKENNIAFREGDRLDGFDPYSNSKSCSELITATYRRSYPDIACPISTARAGNVIGGGDYAKDRIVPDCIRATLNEREIKLRNPNSIRPYQHVLEPIFAYITIILSQTKNLTDASYNIGPPEEDCISTGDLATAFVNLWGPPASWGTTSSDGPHESTYLRLDNNKIREQFNYIPKWRVCYAIEKTIEFTKHCNAGKDPLECMDAQIHEYLFEQ